MIAFHSLDPDLNACAPKQAGPSPFRMECVLDRQPGAQLSIEDPARFAEEIQARVRAQSP